jgi:hypothetical protein
LLVIGPEHGRVFREAGRPRARLLEETHRPAAEVTRGAGGLAEGIAAGTVDDPSALVPKLAGQERSRRRQRRPVQDGVRKLGPIEAPACPAVYRT